MAALLGLSAKHLTKRAAKSSFIGAPLCNRRLRARRRSLYDRQELRHLARLSDVTKSRHPEAVPVPRMNT